MATATDTEWTLTRIYINHTKKNQWYGIWRREGSNNVIHEEVAGSGITEAEAWKMGLEKHVTWAHTSRPPRNHGRFDVNSPPCQENN